MAHHFFSFMRTSCVISLFLPVLLWCIVVAIANMVIPQALRAFIFDRIMGPLRDCILSRLPLYGRIYQTFDALNILSYLAQKVTRKSNFKYPTPDKIHAVRDADTIIHNLQYPLWHAMTIYPPWYLSVLGLRFTIRPSTKDLTSQWFRLKEEDWIDHDGFVDQKYSWLNLCVPCRGINSIYHPSYYLIKDDATKTYVLTIRGSSTTTNWRSDGIGASVDFIIGDVALGKAHKGILQSARNVYDRVIDHLHSIPDEYQLIITGHSLGAGVAAMVGLLLLFTQGNDRVCSKLTVYAFGPPPIVSETLGDHALSQTHIKCIILNTDVVSRFGAEQLRNYPRDLSTKSVVEAPSSPDLCLFPAGQIYWFVPKDLERGKGGYGLNAFLDMWNTARYGKNEWRLCDVSANRQIYGELVLDGFESVYSHHVYRYAWAVGIDLDLNEKDIRKIQKSRCYVTLSDDALPMNAKTAELLMSVPCAPLPNLIQGVSASEPAMSHEQLVTATQLKHSLSATSITPTTPALQKVESNLTYTRMAKTTKEVSNKSGSEIQAMLAAKYTHKEAPEELETDEESSYDDHEIEEIERRKTGTLEKTKSEKVLSIKLVRPGTATEWKDDDLNAMEAAMSKQLQAMKSQNSMKNVMAKDDDLNLNSTQSAKSKQVEDMIMTGNSLFGKHANDEKDKEEDSENEFETDPNDDDEFIPNDEDIASLLTAKPQPQGLQVNGRRESQLFRLKSTGKWDKDRLEQENEEMQAQLTSLLIANKPSGE